MPEIHLCILGFLFFLLVCKTSDLKEGNSQLMFIVFVYMN